VLPFELTQEFSRSIHPSGIGGLSDFLELKNFTKPNVAPGYAEVSLLRVLADHRKTFASDPRDKVYAFLGVSSTTLEVDYSRSVRDVYTGIVETMVSTSSSLNVICHRLAPDANPTYTLPSWVPDWSVQESEPILPISSSRAGGSTPKVKFLSRDGLRILSSAGFTVGLVQASAQLPRHGIEGVMIYRWSI